MSQSPDTDGGAQWLSTSEAAAALGVSERTIQRRAAKGELTARKVATPDGEKWEIQLSAASGATSVPTVPPTVPPPIHAQNRVSGAKVPPSVPPQVPPSDAIQDRRELDAMRAQLVEQLKGENQFLRAALEQRDRDAAELRAALRKALEIAPRQLTSGDGAGAAKTQSSMIPNPPQSAMVDDEQQPDQQAPTRGDGLKLVRDGIRRILKR